MARVLRRTLTLMLAVVTIGVVAPAPAFADIGGGCRNVVNIRTCISVASGTTNPLKSDYYIDVRSNGEYRGELYVVFTNTTSNTGHVQGDCDRGAARDFVFKGSWAPVAGHSPVYSTTKMAGRNCAYTYVALYNRSGQFIYSGASWWQRW